MSLSPRRTQSSIIRTDDPIELSSRVIDTGVDDEPTNRVTNALTELDDGLSIVESFSHVYTFRTSDGLVCFDATGPHQGTRVVETLRGWSTDRIDRIVYTHGHVDHVGGSGAFAADAAARRHRTPEIVGHDRIPARLRRYQRTNGYNVTINRRQFGGIAPRHQMGLATDAEQFLPPDVLWPTHTYSDRAVVTAGEVEFHLHAAQGETDDHTWTWVPKYRALCTGDLVLWVFPNAGNPQKVQRYPLEWARALREMQAYDAELLLPAHGLPVRGRDRIRTVLDDMASALEHLVDATLELMNSGATLDQILHEVTLPDDVLDTPWMRPVYDEPEFVVRNVWRLYGGWWTGDAAELKPASKHALASELVGLAGGTEPLRVRAEQLAASGDWRLACHLIELAAQAAPDDPGVHATRAEIYQGRRDTERSLMAKGIFAAAVRESLAVVPPGGRRPS